MERTVSQYDVVDNSTGQIVRSYHVETAREQSKQRTLASRYADKRDQAYGAVRFIVRPVWL